MQKILHLIRVQDSVAVLTKIGTFRQIGKGVGGMAGVSRVLWCDPKIFFIEFFCKPYISFMPDAAYCFLTLE